MSVDEMKKEVDEFIKELFRGFSTFIMATVDEKKLAVLEKVYKGSSKDTKEVYDEIPLKLTDSIQEYITGKKDEKLITDIYKYVIMLRSLGIIVNNSDAFASLKMEKSRAEDKSKKLGKENELLAEQLAECRTILDSKKGSFQAVG